MLLFVFGVLVAFHVASCRLDNDLSQRHQNRGPIGEDSQTSKPMGSASLYFPTDVDIMTLRSFVVSRRLGSVTQLADQYGAAYHSTKPYINDQEKVLDQEFIKALLAGQYTRADEFFSRYSDLIPTDPSLSPSSLVLGRMGFTQVWKFAERYRMLSPGESFSESASKELLDAADKCAAFFTRATESDPGNSIYKGFAADCNLLRGQAPQGELYLLKGLTFASQAIRRNPEFNLFTVGYVLSSLPVERPEFGLGLEMMWRNLDLCFDTKIDREKPNVKVYIRDFAAIGAKRFCVNSAISPHNFEGFFLIFGDLLVKSGKPQVAKEMYQNATLLPSFYTWPHRDRLLERIRTADANVSLFQTKIDPMVKPTHGTIAFNTEYSCMVCHQK